jgi:hypothetical protein
MQGQHAPRPGTGRRLRADHALELADQPDCRQGGARARRRLHHGAEAVRIRAIQRAAVGPGHARGGRTGGRVQSHQRRRGQGRRAAGRASGDRHGLVHRFDARGHGCRARRRRYGQARASGTRRQVAEHRARRRRLRARRQARACSTCMQNSGQSCNAPTRMLVPAAKLGEVEAIARARPPSAVVGDPTAEATTLGPLVSKLQFDRVEALHRERDRRRRACVVGGTGRPDGLMRGLLRQADDLLECRQRHDDRARGDLRAGAVHPALHSEEEAIAASPTIRPTGSPAYVWSRDPATPGTRVSRRIRAGQVSMNGASAICRTPFGGFKMSGNGREYGEYRLARLSRGQGGHRRRCRLSKSAHGG